VELVTSTIGTVIFRNGKNCMGKYSHHWWKKITFSQGLQIGKYCGFVSYVLLFLAKAKGSFLCNENGLSFSSMLHIHFCQAKSCFPRRKQLRLK
jgi:hypothetical protein